MLDSAEAAVAGASAAQDEKSSRPMAEALADVGTGRFFANRGQRELVKHGFHLLPGCGGERATPQPGGLLRIEGPILRCEISFVHLGVNYTPAFTDSARRGILAPVQTATGEIG